MNRYFNHFKTVNHHRFLVFRLAISSGIFYRGLVHDLSKYSPTEFLESARYYTDGTHSPIQDCKKEKGYSLAWIHHTAKNKHHYEYWYDPSSEKIPAMPYVYAVEMICDRVASGMTYHRKDFQDSYPYEYFLKEMSLYGYMINPKIRKFMEQVFLDLKNHGKKYIFQKKYFQKTYNNSIVGDYQ